MRIGVIGLGYVGSSVAALFSKKYIVNLYDKDPIKSELLANGRSPIKDKLAEKEILKRKGNFIVSKDIDECSKNSDVIFICVSTDLNKTGNGLETRNLEDCVLKARKCNRKNLIIIKSTIPYNFLPNFLIDNNLTNVFYVPEFLRESEAYKDITKPSRIVIGCIKKEKTQANFIKNVYESVLTKSTKFLIVTYREAAAIKLFSNTYLAMRVAFFNELDTYALFNNLDSKKIIDGVCCDPRIGNYYNNPSFAYGGYCLPKDTIDLENECKGFTLSLISSISKSNTERLNRIISNIKNSISAFEPAKCKLGFYRLLPKKNACSIRNSPTLYILENIKKLPKVEIKIYEPFLDGDRFNGIIVENDLNKFKQWANIIIANRKTKDIEDVKYKVYSRDVFHKD